MLAFIGKTASSTLGVLNSGSTRTSLLPSIFLSYENIFNFRRNVTLLIGPYNHRRATKLVGLNSLQPRKSPMIRSGSQAADNHPNSEINPSSSISSSYSSVDLKYVILSTVYDPIERLIRVTWGDGHRSTFHMIWLRDEDNSPASYDVATGQRLTNSAALPLDIGATHIRVADGGRRLIVEWDRVVAGVTQSAFDSGFLRSHCACAPERSTAAPGALPPYAYTWGKELEAVLPTLAVPYADLMCPGDAGERAVLRLLGMVRSYGVAVVSGTPVCKAESQRVVERLAPVRHTLYGGFWETRVLPPDDADNIDRSRCPRRRTNAHALSRGAHAHAALTPTRTRLMTGASKASRR